ncbi:DUF2332 domain-containing protein [Sulfitobacter albidus]|uniref:DUF2332 domain-containing protein n=1 Tax=Sulfitobacter albidus TaxID=2829501 RepID=UPI003D689F2A
MSALEAAFRHQADSCEALGSPFMGRLLRILAEDWPTDSALARFIASFGGNIGPAGHSLPLRICGGLHALVLTRRDADLIAAYPPADVADRDLRAAVLAAITAHGDFLIDWCKSPPQTNEVRRSAAMIAGARVAVSHFPLPLHLSELGASGGLNLMWDHYTLDIGKARFGPPVPALTLTPEWTGAPPPDAAPQIAARAGVDLNPLSPGDGEDMLRLTAFLWPDQPERLSMTRAAGSVMTAPLVKGDAIEWLSARLAAAPQGRLHLIQHSVAWQYFPAAAQSHGRALIEAAGPRPPRTVPSPGCRWRATATPPGARGRRWCCGCGRAISRSIWGARISTDAGSTGAIPADAAAGFCAAARRD